MLPQVVAVFEERGELGDANRAVGVGVDLRKHLRICHFLQEDSSAAYGERGREAGRQILGAAKVLAR